MNYLDLPLEELINYKPLQTKEPDFDTFWADNKAEEQIQPLNSVEERIDYPLDKVKIFDVYYDGFNNSRIRSRLILPQNASDDNKVPAIAFFHGYNNNDTVYCNTFKYILLGYAVFLVDVRGQNIKSPDHNSYENGGVLGWTTSGINNPENYYYRYVYMDGVRAIHYLSERGDIDSERIAVEGISQGGGIALAVGALCPQVKAIMADVPYLCHFQRAFLKALNSPYLEISHYFRLFDSLHRTENDLFRTLSYFDNLNLASYIKADTILSICLEDTICPPSTSIAAYNYIEAKKELRLYPDFSHEVPTQQEEEKILFINSRFKK